MDKKLRPNARKADLVVQETGDEVLVYDLTTNKASCLNDTSAFVWQNCNGENSIADIATALGRKTNQAVNDDFVWLAIDQLAKNGLLEDKVSSNEIFSGMSRRDVIKKVGLGAMIALPIVSSLVAPTAASAASVCGTACTCPNGSGTNCSHPACAAPSACVLCGTLGSGNSGGPGLKAGTCGVV